METATRDPHEYPGCGAAGVPHDQYACKSCKSCWRMLPWEHRDTIMRTWHVRLRTGQATAHMAAMLDALNWYRLHHPKHRGAE